jgi:hypothetical protein
MKKFYVHDGKTKQGPFDVTQLKQQNISKDTPVWYDGLTEWAEAGKVDDLKEIFTPEPPALTRKPELSSWPHNLRSDPRRNPMRERNSKLRWILLVPVILIMGVMAAIYKQDESAAIQSAPTKEAEKEKRKEPVRETSVTNSDDGLKRKVRNNIRTYVKAESNKYEHSRLGGISDLEITVNNTTDYTLDKVHVKINYIKANGAIWETRYEDFFSIKPNSSLTHKIADTKRGTRVEYEVVSIKSKSLGMN